MLQTANAEVAHVVRNEEVVQLPLNARQFLQLALLSDNVGHAVQRVKLIF